MPLTAEQQQLVDLVIERAEQACRYALKHQNFVRSETHEEYRSGWEVAAHVCEGAIRDHVMTHIERDLKDAQHEPDAATKSIVSYLNNLQPTNT